MSTPSLEEVLALPSVAWPERKNLPDSPGLYFVISGEWITYIGKSEKSLRRRWVQRNESRRMMYFGHFRIAYMVIEDVASIGEREIEAIQAFSLPVNGSHIPGQYSRLQSKWPFLRIDDLRKLRRMRKEGAVALRNRKPPTPPA